MNNQHRVVSSESEELILVDREDNEIGFISKSDAHNGNGVLHRAFSLFLFNESGELLLQRRAPEKRLWGGYWSNSCCSHPRRGESVIDLHHDVPDLFVPHFVMGLSHGGDESVRRQVAEGRLTILLGPGPP